MKIFKIVLLWTLAILFCLTIYNSGHSTYYRYQNKGGLDLDYKEYRGETTNKWWNLYDCEKCSYVGTREIFDKQPEMRTFFIAMILGLSVFSASRTNRKTKKKVSSTASFPLTNYEIINPDLSPNLSGGKVRHMHLQESSPWEEVELT